MLEKSDLLGAWQLESWSIGHEGRDDVSFPFGENPIGLLLYTSDDWMSVSVCASGRAALPPGLPQSLPDEALADAYRGYFHYAGRFRVRGDNVTHYVTQSLDPGFVGSEQQRHVELDGLTLVLSWRDEVAGEVRFHHHVWHKLGAVE
jgi:hypothetical protein